jgi:hypothetical protein
MNKEAAIKNSSSLHGPRALTVSALTVLLFLAIVLVASNVSGQTTPAARGKTFATPLEAGNSLIDAAEKYDVDTLKELLGPDSYDIIHTGEPALDSEKAKEFAALGRAKLSINLDNKTRAILLVGEDEWPFPIPIVKSGNSWFFDTRTGRQELLFRRIGRNELDAIQICRGYVEAQHEYALLRKVNGVNQYAQRIVSAEGKQDGLAWKNADGTWDGPVGERIAAAIARGYSKRTEPYHGYFFKVLKGQGPAAPLGELDFVVKGVMIGGFALIASPAQYRNTGVQTFMVSHDGLVYQKDLGPETLAIFQSIDRFNPDKTWSPVVERAPLIP